MSRRALKGESAFGHRAVHLVTTCLFALSFLMISDVCCGLNSAHTSAAEIVAGPDVHPSEWLLTHGDIPACPRDAEELRKEWLEKGREGIVGLIWAGRQVQLFSKASAVMTRFNHLYGDGGDRTQRIRLKVERLGASGSISGRFNVSPPTGTGEAALEVRMTAKELVVLTRGGKVIARLPEASSAGQTHVVEFTTFGNRFSVTWNGSEIATGALQDRADKEGWTEIGVHDGGVTLCEFQERWLGPSAELPEPKKGKLLYEETFSGKSLESNWLTLGAPILAEESGYLFSHMSLGVLRKRFEGPLMVEVVMQPAFNRFVSAGVTDAIILWMLDTPEKDLISRLNGLPDAKRSRFEALPFYWLDIGGTNNATTRFRKGPGLWLTRQLSNQNRLLPPEGELRLLLIQNGAHTEVRVNGERWFSCFDPQPHTEGHIGFRGFSGMAPEGTPTLRIRDLKIWKIEQ